MEISKLHKRSTFTTPKIDSLERDHVVSRDVKGNAALVVLDLLKDEEFKEGDEVTIDVRVLIQRK
jgi:hypothetical protein